MKTKTVIKDWIEFPERFVIPLEPPAYPGLALQPLSVPVIQSISINPCIQQQEIA